MNKEKFNEDMNSLPKEIKQGLYSVANRIDSYSETKNPEDVVDALKDLFTLITMLAIEGNNK